MAIQSPTWSLAEAKARLSEVVDRAVNEGPQTITRRGRDAVVVVSAEEWGRKTRRRGNLLEFLQSSPLRDAGIEFERVQDGPRQVDL